MATLNDNVDYSLLSISWYTADENQPYSCYGKKFLTVSKLQIKLLKFQKLFVNQNTNLQLFRNVVNKNCYVRIELWKKIVREAS